MKTMTKKEYLKFCANAESMDVYDGRGKYDQYECEVCGNKIFTTYGEKGVTPFTTVCPRCRGTMFHNATFNEAPEGVDVIKWVRPSYRSYRKSTDAVKDHINKGGLVMETKPYVKTV